MKAILEKLSAYTVLGYLLPGVLFVILGERLTSFSLIQRSWVAGIVLYYFIGLVISRVGVLIVQPVLERIGFVEEAPYEDYVEASANRIQGLMSYRYGTACFGRCVRCVMMLIGLKIGEKVIGVLPWGADVYDFVMLAGLVLLLLFSYRKQAQAVVRRVRYVGKKGRG